MKVIAFNGSPRKDGNTTVLMGHLLRESEKESTAGVVGSCFLPFRRNPEYVLGDDVIVTIMGILGTVFLDVHYSSIA
jgi:hypothetical protein